MSEQESRARLIRDTERGKDVGTTIYSSAEEDNPSMKYCQISFLVVSVLVVLIVLIISIAESIKYSKGTYIFLGLSMLGFLVLNFILMVFVSKGELDRRRKWFIPVMEACIIIESIFTAIAILS